MSAAPIVLVHADNFFPGAPAAPSCALDSVVAGCGGTTLAFSKIAELRSSPALFVLATLSWEEWPHALRQIKSRWRDALALAVLQESGHGSLGQPGLPSGLDDFLYEPVRETELRVRIERLMAACPHYPEARDFDRFKAEHQLASLIGASEAFAGALRKIPLLARVDATVLITGETGTGKELVARALHYNGLRHKGPFVPCNCGALPDHLIENELFGHARGAYTDARAEQKGLLEIADGGTLLLDEVDSLTPSGQVKLLRFLQDREYRQLGSHQLRRADVRVLAATNGNLEQLVEQRRFREDLFHRLNVLQLHIPPLRERSSDIALLAHAFLRRACAQLERPLLRFSPQALEALHGHDWPGNIRELESVVQRAAILSTSPVIEAADLGVRAKDEPAKDSEIHFEQAKRQAIDRFEQRYLSGLLNAEGGNVSRAARGAGIERRTLQRLLRKHGLSPSAFHA